MTGVTFIWIKRDGGEHLGVGAVVRDGAERVEQALVQVAHLLLGGHERIDVCALRRGRVVLVEIVELVQRLVAERLEIGERARRGSSAWIGARAPE